MLAKQGQEITTVGSGPGYWAWHYRLRKKPFRHEKSRAQRLLPPDKDTQFTPNNYGDWRVNRFEIL